MKSYTEVFHEVCEGSDPFPFQLRFHESTSALKILKVPTGLGKTDTVLVDWVVRRPTKRLVYCLPGRALTKQIASVARARISAAGLSEEIRVIELMGGESGLEETLSPHESAILVGTQDILISRALNRGYARSPFRWPIDFALLNNDVSWVLDEMQLLGEALATSTQLSAFRKQFGIFGTFACTWMSATFDPDWLNTVDFQDGPEVIDLLPEDIESSRIVKARHSASKLIAAGEKCSTPAGCAQFVAQEHKSGELTLVICNTVARAQEIYAELSQLHVPDLSLLHSRYRPGDRAPIIEKVLQERRGVVVSTQVVEAGIDLNATLLVTDVAPWSSLVQRFGRVNRYGLTPGRIFWVEKPQRQRDQAKKAEGKNEKDLYAPYDPGEVRQAVAILRTLSSASPKDLEGLGKQGAPYTHVLRRRDLLDLFDTTPDLSGNHIDISRFVRNNEGTNVQIAWRQWPKEEPPPLRRLEPGELCPAPLGKDLETLLRREGVEAWTWNYTGRGKWERVDTQKLYPGMRILLRSETGGYDSQTGWKPQSKTSVYELHLSDDQEDDQTSDRSSESVRQTLAQHTDDVVSELNSLLDHVRIEFGDVVTALRDAARYHDWGKAHPVFQSTMHGIDDMNIDPHVAEILAKSESGGGRHARRGFRHELASALAMLASGHSELSAYIVASHHGKVRLSIRSLPHEEVEGGRRIARGIVDGDSLYAADLGGDVAEPAIALDLRWTEMGSETVPRTWSDLLLDLIQKYGPFRLAFLEMLLRIADERASKNAALEIAHV